SLIALVAAGLEEQAIDAVELHGSFASLKEVIEQNGSVRDTPEVFCFGLLERFDVLQLAALVAPRDVRFVEPGERHRQELGGLAEFYRRQGREFDPLK
ncbi:MAG: hypothetical protein ACREJB_07360, partial [Planctomycetaceae bacterium]